MTTTFCKRITGTRRKKGCNERAVGCHYFLITVQVSSCHHWKQCQAAEHKKLNHWTVICINQISLFINWRRWNAAHFNPWLPPSLHAVHSGTHLGDQLLLHCDTDNLHPACSIRMFSYGGFISWFLKKLNMKPEMHTVHVSPVLGVWWLLKHLSMYRVWFVEQSVHKGDTQKYIPRPSLHFHLLHSPAAYTLQHWRGCSKLVHHNAFVITVISQKKKSRNHPLSQKTWKVQVHKDWKVTVFKCPIVLWNYTGSKS